MLSQILEELYVDRIYPTLITMKSRLGDCPATGAATELSAPPGIEQLLAVAASDPAAYVIQTDARGDPVGLTLRHEPAGFLGWVDPNGDDDPYNEDFWLELGAYLEDLAMRATLAGEVARHSLEGGRFGVAKFLREKDLPCLRGMCLGELCHVVQLAIRRGLLIYDRSSRILPAQLHRAAKNARMGVPTTQSKAQCVSTMQELCDLLRKLLRNRPDGLALSQLKRRILREHQMVLSETTFGCTKLIDLARLLAREGECSLWTIGSHLLMLPPGAKLPPGATPPTLGTLGERRLEIWIRSFQAGLRAAFEPGADDSSGTLKPPLCIPPPPGLEACRATHFAGAPIVGG